MIHSAKARFFKSDDTEAFYDLSHLLGDQLRLPTTHHDAVRASPATTQWCAGHVHWRYPGHHYRRVPTEITGDTYLEKKT